EAAYTAAADAIAGMIGWPGKTVDTGEELEPPPVDAQQRRAIDALIAEADVTAIATTPADFGPAIRLKATAGFEPAGGFEPAHRFQSTAWVWAADDPAT